VDGQLLQFPRFGSVPKVQKADCVGTLRANRKNVPPLVKNKKLKRGEHCCHQSGDVAVLVWQDKKRVTMISTYHKDKMRVIVKANKQETKPVVVCDYNKNMLGVELKDCLSGRKVLSGIKSYSGGFSMFQFIMPWSFISVSRITRTWTH
jgi:hypothetical protein